MANSTLASVSATAQQFLGSCAVEGRELFTYLARQLSENEFYPKDALYGERETLGALPNLLLSWREACAIAVGTSTLIYLIYNLYFHPLAKFPGPFWARASLVRDEFL